MHISDAPSIEGPIAGIGHNKAPVAEVFKEKHADLIAEVEKLATDANAKRETLPDGKVNDDDQRDTWIKLGTAAAKVLKRIETARAGEVEALNQEVKEWNRLFGTKTPVPGSLAARCTNIKAFASLAVDDYNTRVAEAERRRLAEEAARMREIENKKLAEAAEAEEAKPVHSDIALNEASAAAHNAAVLERQAVSTTATSVRTDAGTAVATGKWTFRIVDRSKIDLNKVPFSLAEIEAALGRHAREHRDSMPLAGVEFFRESKTQFRG